MASLGHPHSNSFQVEVSDEVSFGTTVEMRMNNNAKTTAAVSRVNLTRDRA